VNVHVHIDRLVVDGPSLSRRERERLVQTLEQDLARHLRQGVTGGDGERGRPTLGGLIAAEVVAALPVDARPVTAHPSRRRERVTGGIGTQPGGTANGRGR
jgi:hypothetical protein